MSARHAPSIAAVLFIAVGCGGKVASESASPSADAGAKCLFQLVAGEAHTCALGGGMAQALYCWGKNDKGQLGLGTVDASSHPAPTRVDALGTDVLRVVAGRDHTCAVKGDGSLWCWGDNSSGQLGSGSIGAVSPTPTRVPDILGLDQRGSTLAAGGAHTCAANGDRTLVCWGDDTFGQLGDGQEGPPTTTPVRVSNVPAIYAVYAGGSHTCAAASDDTLQPWCWGANDFGQVGDGTTARSRPTPARVMLSGEARLVDVSVGKSHSCSTRWVGGSADGIVCWGADDVGQLGLGLATPPKPTPEAVDVGLQVFEVRPGGDHSCARIHGAAWCWGASALGQAGTSIAISAPALVGGLPGNVTSLAVGGRHSCARNFESSEVWCWGANEAGQLGTGTSDANAHPSGERVALPCE